MVKDVTRFIHDRYQQIPSTKPDEIFGTFAP
jgi:hypothetical protein